LKPVSGAQNTLFLSGYLASPVVPLGRLRAIATTRPPSESSQDEVFAKLGNVYMRKTIIPLINIQGKPTSEKK
jgi:hypothetical protein